MRRQLRDPLEKPKAPVFAPEDAEETASGIFDAIADALPGKNPVGFDSPDRPSSAVSEINRQAGRFQDAQIPEAKTSPTVPTTPVSTEKMEEHLKTGLGVQERMVEAVGRVESAILKSKGKGARYS